MNFPTTSTLTVYTDGGARGNPGPAALGVFIENQEGDEIISIGKRLGETTNNVAEYQAVVEALNFIKQNRESFPNLTNIDLYMDSNLVTSQLNGLFKIKNANLRILVFEIKALENEIKVPITYSHVPREENKKADAMVNKALDNLI